MATTSTGMDEASYALALSLGTISSSLSQNKYVTRWLATLSKIPNERDDVKIIWQEQQENK